MPIKVRRKRDGQMYLLIGTGFGAYKSSRPGILGGDFCPLEEEGQMTMVALCDNKGKIRWVDSTTIEIAEVDGKTPQDLLG